MSIYYELLNEVLKKEREANHDKYVGRTKEIRIHPEWFYKLMDDPKMREQQINFNGVEHKINGIPLNIITDIEKWEIIV